MASLASQAFGKYIASLGAHLTRLAFGGEIEDEEEAGFDLEDSDQDSDGSMWGTGGQTVSGILGALQSPHVL